MESSKQAIIPWRNENGNTESNNYLDIIKSTFPLYTNCIWLYGENIIFKKITGFDTPRQNCFHICPQNFR